MKTFIPASLLIVILLSGCSKDTDPTPDPPENQKPIRVMQTILTFESGVGGLFTDTLTFTYDDEGRVTSRTTAQGDRTEQYSYTDGKLTSLKSIGPDSTKENLREAVYSADGDTILIDFSQDGGFYDTVHLTYVFNNKMQTDFWTYLHNVDGGGCGSCSPARQLQKDKWYYNSEGNLIKKTRQTQVDNEEHDWYTITAWDDKKNPKNGQPKINALALSLYIPMESYAEHNPTAYSDGLNTYEIEITYNDEDYPLTFKLKDKDYISTRLIYNR